MARYKGLLDFSGNYEPQKASAFDARANVPTKADLTDASNWTALDGNTYVYNGMTVTVAEDSTASNNGIYVLTDASDVTNIASWLFVGSGGGSTDISALNAFTGSIQIEVDNLTAATSSYLTADDTGSFVYSGSYDSSTNTVTLYRVDGNYDLDLSDLVDAGTDISALNTFTGSIQTEVDNLTNATSSYVTNDETGSFYYSSSVELNTITFYQGDGTTESTTIDTGSATDISALNLHTGSINTFTGSIQIEVDNLTAATSSYLTGEDTGSFLYSGSFDSNTSNIRLYSKDQNYDLDLSTLAGGTGGLAITASYTGSELTKNVRSFDFEGNGVKATNVGNAVTVTITQVDTGSFVTNDQTSSFVTNNETGSFYYSSSVDLNTITFFQGDGTTENVTVDTGSATDISALNLHTGSINTFTGSIQIEVDNLTALTSSYITNSQTSSMAVGSAINTYITVKNKHTGTIAKGMPCYITGSGTSGNVVGVVPADAGDPTYMPAGVVLAEELTNPGDEGIGYINGWINGVDTSAFQSGDNIYVAVGGGYTNIKPTGNNLIQKLGNVEKVHPSNGSGVIVGAGRANDVPNINPGHFWVGDNDWVPQAVSTGSFLTGEDTGSFLYSGSFDSSTNAITLYSADQDYNLDLSGLAGGGSGLAITASYTGSELTKNVRSFDFEGNGVKATNVGNAVTVTVTQVDTGSFVTNDQTSSFVTNDETGSFYYSSSVDLNTITFFQGDGTTENVTVDTGSTIVPGNDTEVIYNKNGQFEATASFTFDNNGGPGLTIDGSVENQNASIIVSGSDTSSVLVGESLIWNSVSSNLTSINRNYAAGGTGNELLFQTDTGNEGPCWVLGSSLPTIATVSDANFNIFPGYNNSETRTNDRAYLFRVRKSITSANQPVLLEVSRSGQVYMPELENTTTPHIVGYDSTTGELTYYSTGSFGGGSINTGSFYVSSSLSNNTITFTQGDGTTESVTVTGSNIYNTNGTLIADRTLNGGGSNSLTFTNLTNFSVLNATSSIEGPLYLLAGIPNATKSDVLYLDTSTGEVSYGAASALFNTSSLLITGSVNNTTLTLTKGDGTTFDLTVTGSNIYNTDGTLTADRTVTAGPGATGKSLTFEFANANFIINSDPTREVQINNLDTVDTPRVVGYADGVLRAMPTSSFKPGGPVNTFQFNKNNAFSGSSLFFDSATEYVGIGESSPDRPLHITDIDPVAIKLERTDAPEVGIQFFGNGASGGGAIIRGLNNDFEVIQRDTVTVANERNLFISESGEVHAPRLNNTTTPNIVGYDSATGELTYYSTGSFGSGGGSINTGSFYVSSSINSTGDTITFNQGDGTTESVTVTPDYTIQRAIQYVPQDSLLGATNLQLIVGSVGINAGQDTATTSAISQLTGRTAAGDAFITATLYATNGVAKAVSVQAIQPGGEVTFKTDGVVAEDSWIMYHVFLP